MFEAYGYQFDTLSSACRYKALIRILDRAKLDAGARLRMVQRFMGIHGGRLATEKAA